MKVLSEEHKRKIAEKLRGRKLSREHKRNLRKSHLGISVRGFGWKHSNETKAKIRNSLSGKRTRPIGYRHSTGTIRKIAESNRGLKRSEETRKKLSISHLGKSSWQGRKHLPKTRRKMSHIAQKAFADGRKQWNYIQDRDDLLSKGKLRNDTAYKEWRKRILMRDKGKCALQNDECKGRLETHHIHSWRMHPALRYDIKNGITLCHYHHPRKRDEEKLAPILQDLVNRRK